jgi:hypothetical protein
MISVRQATKSSNKGTGDDNTAGLELPIKLTDNQQKQIKAATGKSITELNIDLASTGHLTEKNLEQLAGGAQKVRKSPT